MGPPVAWTMSPLHHTAAAPEQRNDTMLVGMVNRVDLSEGPAGTVSKCGGAET